MFEATKIEEFTHQNLSKREIKNIQKKTSLPELKGTNR